MKKKIVILGSTGSIGTTTYNIIKKNKQDFNVVLLTTNKNINKILNQAKKLNVKNIIVSSRPHYLKLKQKTINKNIKIHNSLNELTKIIKSKIDYTMCGITGLAGLKPTLDSIKFSKKIAIANKESIICAWNLIKRKLKKYETEFIPIDSEHFSIWSLLNNYKNKDVEEVIITASGGPFLKLPLKKFSKIKPKAAINHPNWKMGNKISIDSATMINKVFEVIEAQRIFDIDLKKFKILIHSNSYVHAIIKFNDGLTKILIHDTDMKIPIFNSLYSKNFKKINSKKLNINSLNNLNFIKPDNKRYPSLKILKLINKKNSLYETVLVSANDELVEMFQCNKITYIDIVKKLNKILRMKIFIKFKNKRPKNYKELIKLSNFVRLKTRSLCI